MKNIFLKILLLLLISSCSAIKNSSKNDEIFTVEISENWKKKKGVQGNSYWLPIKKDKSKAKISIFSYEIKKITNKGKEIYKIKYPNTFTVQYDSLEDYLLSFHDGQKVTYKLDVLKSDIYGKVYSLSTSNTFHKNKFKTLKLVFIKNGRIFTLEFSSKDKFFDRYLKEVNKIFSSFKIIGSF